MYIRVCNYKSMSYTNVTDKFEITEAKLQMQDRYRVQAQSNNREQKIVYAVLGGVMSEHHPIIMSRCRDSVYPYAVNELLRETRTLMDYSPLMSRTISDYMSFHIRDKRLLNEASAIIARRLRDIR